MTDNDLKYWAFLSYSQQDNREPQPDARNASHRCWGNWLHDALETFSIPAEFIGQINGRGETIPERIQPIFQDERELPEDANLSADMRRALEQSRCLIVICSPRSAQSLQVNEAVRYFKQLGRGSRILPIVVAGEPHAGNQPGSSPEDECFVPALRHPVRPDGTIDTTRRAGKHVFVDARHGLDKREILAKDHRNAEADLEMAKIQLIAEVIGVGFNGLWWREQKRHFIDLTEAQYQVRAAQIQAAEAQRQTREAQDKVLAIQNLPRDVHGQIQEAQIKAQAAENQTREAQKQLQEFQNKDRDAQGQLEETRNQVLANESKFQEAQNQAREARHQAEEARRQIQELQSQAHTAQNQVQDTPDKTRRARRLTMVFAVLAVLALMAAGTAASIAWSQRKVASQALANVAAEDGWEPDLTQGGMDMEQIRQALLKISAAEAVENRRRSLDKLAAWIPKGEIIETLKASSIILDDPARRRFQKQLLIRLGWADPLSAMADASAIEGKIVQDDGVNGSGTYFQLAVLGNWMKTDLPGAFNWVCQMPDADSRNRALEKIIPALADNNPTNTLAQLNDLKPAPDEGIYALLFQRWAANDPVQAIQQWQQLPSHDQNGNILCAIMTTWVDQSPDAALNWVNSQPDSETKNWARETCIGELAKTDAPRALTLAESLPAGNWRSAIIAGVFNAWAARDLAAATTACLQLPDGIAKENALECVLNQRLTQAPAADPETADNWLDSFLKTNSQPEQVQSVIKAWAKCEPAAVAKWLANLPVGTASEGMVDSFLEGAVAKYPEFAGQWTAAVTNELQRQKYQIQIARQWMKTDPSAALKWINGQDLPQAIKELK